MLFWENSWIWTPLPLYIGVHWPENEPHLRMSRESWKDVEMELLDAAYPWENFLSSLSTPKFMSQDIYVLFNSDVQLPGAEGFLSDPGTESSLWERQSWPFPSPPVTPQGSRTNLQQCRQQHLGVYPNITGVVSSISSETGKKMKMYSQKWWF